MPRTKGGVVSRRRRNRVLKQAKGYFGSKHCLFKVANQQVMKSLVYAYRDRKNNKRNSHNFCNNNSIYNINNNKNLLSNLEQQYSSQSACRC